MSTRSVMFLALAGLAGVAFAGSKAAPWPAGEMNPAAPTVLAFYEGQCSGWADKSHLKGAARDAYLADCLKDAPAIWPVGSDGGGGGEE